jgi:hypothetical protein
MSIVIDATYHDGALKLDGPLPLNENERVKVTIEPIAPRRPITYGLIGWTGDPEAVRRIALDPEFGVQESP